MGSIPLTCTFCPFNASKKNIKIQTLKLASSGGDFKGAQPLGGKFFTEVICGNYFLAPGKKSDDTFAGIFQFPNIARPGIIRKFFP
jgi:hypothetical protein